MPSPTSSTASIEKTRSERLFELAAKATQELNFELKLDEASTTPTQACFEFTTPRGIGRITVGVPGEDVQIAGVLTRTDGGSCNIQLRTKSCIKPVIQGDLFDRYEDDEVIKILCAIFAEMHGSARPPRNRKLEQAALELATVA